MKTLKYIMVCLNFVVGYFVAMGVYGYLIAYSVQRKESYLWATGFWLAVLVVLDLIWLAIIWIARRQGGPRAGKIPPNSLKTLEGDPGIEPGNYIAITIT